MKTTHDNNTLTLYLAGRVDANNAPNIEAEIAQELAKFPGLIPAFDASELEYISSAGLRVLLKFRKQFGQNLDVFNASSEVYDIFEVTGFTQLLNVRKRLRSVSVEGCPVIGGGYFSTVYRLDGDTIIKVFNRAPTTLAKIEEDQRRAREIFIRDIPTAISFDVVRCGEYYGIVYEMIDALSLSRTVMQQPERLPELGRKMGALLKKLHTTEYPAGTFPDAVGYVYKSTKRLHEHGLISGAEYDMLNRFADSIPRRNTLIHYDFHPNNKLVQGDELVLIDVGDAALGHPVLDLAALYFVAFTTTRHMNAPASVIEQIVGCSFSAMTDLWRGMLREYFHSSTIEHYDDVIEGYGMLRGLYVSSSFIGTDRFDAVYSPMMRKCLDYLSANGLKSLEGF